MCLWRHIWCFYHYSWLSLSRPRLSRITACLDVKIWSLLKHENLTTGKRNIVEKREQFLLFPQYFQYIQILSVQPHIYLLNVVVWIMFSSILQIWYVEVRISRSIWESPLEFEITRVDCICSPSLLLLVPRDGRIVLRDYDISWVYLLICSYK